MPQKGGRVLYVGFYVNDVPLPADVTATREGKVLGKFCEIIYSHDDRRTTGEE